MTKHFLKLLVGVSLLMAFQCDDDIDFSRDRLFHLGFYTTWEYDSETINGISDLSVKCCRYFEFDPDQNLDDMVGNFWFWEDSTNYYQGTFTVDTLNAEVIFDRIDREQIIYGYSMSDSLDYLKFYYVEDSLNIEQGWRRLY